MSSVQRDWWTADQPADIARDACAIRLTSGVGFATDYLRDQEPLFVHCHAGRSRSVVILAMALMRHQGLSKSAALAAISRRREIALTPGIEAMFRWVD